MGGLTRLAAMALSILLEAPVAAGLVAVQGARPPAWVAAALAAGAGTALTHPFVWHGALALYPRVGVPLTLVVVESAAILAEAWIYARFAGVPPRRALAISAAANGFSASVGAWLTW